MPTTQRDAQALTYIAQRLRQETTGANEWDNTGTYSVIAALIGQNLDITTQRVTRHATDPTAKTPGAINRPYIPDTAGPQPRHPATAGAPDECPNHPGEYATNCRPCTADHLAGDTPTTRTHQPNRPTPTYQAARLRHENGDTVVRATTGPLQRLTEPQ